MKKYTLSFSAILFFLALVIHQNRVLAQDKGSATFCTSLTKMIASAGKNFTDIKGPVIDSLNGIMKWKSSAGLPNTVLSILVDEPALSRYYLGKYRTTASKDTIDAQYDKLADYLAKCMKPKGFQFQNMKNETGLPSVDDIFYRLPDDSKVPMDKQPYVKLQVHYDETTKLYYITIMVGGSLL